jgi:lipoprotein-anchoring transpeptidase ErfK/SrfK
MKFLSKGLLESKNLLIFVLCIWSFAMLLIGLLMLSKNRNEDLVKYIQEDIKEVEVETLIPTVASASTTEVVGVTDSPNYNILFCYMDFCKKLENEKFLKMIQDGDISKDLFNTWVHSDVEKYFSPLYSKKELVKNSKGEYLSRISEYVPNYTVVYNSLNTKYRSGEHDIIVEIPSIMTASTDGKFAYKYIEVDNTQQKLYVWIDGVVVREIFLSGAREDSSVRGVFKIVDKGLQPIAPGNKYMPYWMAFYYEPTKSTWYGLHGLIWIPRSDGSRWVESESNIGKRISGGCIRMLVEDAKYLYGIFEKGDYVLIHD